MSDAVNASFRDPAGRVVFVDGRVVRLIADGGRECWNVYRGSKALAGFRESKRLIDFETLSVDQAAKVATQAGLPDAVEAAEHPVVRFPNYPHEWAPQMLRAAADLTLDMARALLAEDVVLKDATPFNIMFEGPRPVFLDALSFRKRSDGEGLWLAESQFLRSFVYPLIANARLQRPLSSVFLDDREGVPGEQAVRALGRLERLRPAFLLSVTLPAYLERRSKAVWTTKGVASAHLAKRSDEQAHYAMERLYRRLGRLIGTIDRRTPASHWLSYGDRTHYSSEAAEEKVDFVKSCLSLAQPSRALDVGCNTGEFSEIAARQGASVVAVDSDPDVVGAIWTRAHEEGLDILPLVQNIAKPSPALGWMNLETRSFLDRAQGGFDLVMMLALIHHLVVSERLRLAEITTLAANLTSQWLVIEFVGPEDPMFQAISQWREDPPEAYDQTAFEEAFQNHFVIERRQTVSDSDRTLYLLAKRANS